MKSYEMDSLYILDNEYTGDAPKYEQLAQEYQDILNEYVTILKSFETDHALEGRCGISVTQFAHLVTDMLGMHHSEYISDNSENMKSYISDIDEADDVLY